MPRLFVDHLLAAGEKLWLSLPQSHYLLHVLRLKVGQSLLLFNGRDGAWEAQIESVSAKKVLLEINRLIRPQPEASWRISLFFAPLKAHRLEMLLEKATEIGVTELIPCLTDHTQVRRLNPSRLEALVREAAEQSGRLTVPLIAPLAPLATHLSKKQEEEQILFFCDFEAPSFLLQLEQQALLLQQKKSVGLIIGPEGGWSPAERIHLMRTFPRLIPVRLGKTVLRAETAALVALALLLNFQEKKETP